MERKIEEALEAWFRAEGWSLDTQGDHFATDCDETSINLSRLARHVAAELA